MLGYAGLRVREYSDRGVVVCPVFNADPSACAVAVYRDPLVGVVVTVLLLWSLTDQEPVATMGDPDAVCDERAAGVQRKEGNLARHVARVGCWRGLSGSWLGASAGGVFALAAIIKLPLLLFAVYFVGMRQWRVVFGYGLTLSTITASPSGMRGGPVMCPGTAG